jgi:N-methylhydantoinase A/oxoprolinase/acetone carboxylase beta subunit
LRLAVRERLDEQGEVLTALAADQVEEAVAELLKQGVESIAICFLHSYQNPGHEQAAADIARRLAPRLPCSLSSDVAPQIREYPRLSTTVANAYVRPLMTRYVERTTAALGELGFARGFYMMVSGAVVTSAVAEQAPIRLVDSGAAAGAVAASYYGRLLARERLISFEMGGTTAKFCFVDQGEPAFTNEFEVARVDRFKKGSGFAIAIPATEMVEIGAGGGSIAWIDELGLLKVGPRSAGSTPGPACYGLGGEEPTVTDANLLLGYLDPAYFLGGRMALRADLARQSMERLASALQVSELDVAWGIHRIVTENMVNAAREYIAERGRDARAYHLIAFGGAGPAHAVQFARSLRISEVIIPRSAGVTSAVGALASPFGFDFVRSYIARLRQLDLARVNRLFGDLEREAIALLTAAGVPKGEVHLRRYCDMRYVGQTHEIRVPVPGGELVVSDLSAIEQAYAHEYERLYHHPNLDYELECVNWRLFASGPRPAFTLAAQEPSEEPLRGGAQKGQRKAYFGESAGFSLCPVYERGRLSAGLELEGAAIVEEQESTLVIPPGVHARCDELQNLILKL